MVIQHENSDDKLLINRVSAGDGCRSVDKYLSSYYEVDNFED
jgi:hypothetical protein